MILRFEIAVFTTHRRVCDLGQHGVKMTVRSGSFTGFPFAGTFMVPRTAAGPGRKVLVAGKSTHISSGFRQQRSSSTLADSHNHIELFYCGSKRGGRYRPEPFADAGDLLFEKIVLPEQLPQQKSVMLSEISLQCALQLGNLAAQLRASQIRQYRY